MLRYSSSQSNQIARGENENVRRQPDYVTRHSVLRKVSSQTGTAEGGFGPLVNRLQRLQPLAEQEICALDKLTRHSQAQPAGYPLFQEDARCDHVCVLIEGIACRYRMLADGRRQILGYILPGDICDVQFVTVGAPDHSVNLLTKGLVVKIATTKLFEVLAAFPAIRRAVEIGASIDKAILRQWLVNLAQRSASQRLGHFLCEYLVRMEQICCLDDNGSVPFEINQVALADTLGMSTVHVNRTLQSLRAANLIVLRNRHLVVLDREQLVALASFKADYLRIREGFG